MRRASLAGVVTRVTSWVGLVLLTLVPALGCKERAPRPLVLPAVERTWVPLSGLPLRGPATAQVTLLVFCDFQSPYCARAAERLRELKLANGDALRIQYRFNPLPLYPQSQLAAEASVAAAEQGQFWRYHDILFAHQDALDRASLERYAQELGLELPRFRDALDTERARQKVDDDSLLAGKLQARGAPVFYVNGRPVRGLVPTDVLQKLIDEEKAVARSVLDSGVEPKALYQRIAGRDAATENPPATSTALPENLPATSSAPPEPAPVPNVSLSDPDPVYKVPVGESPSKGPADARVTIVLWSDFECTRCGSFEAALDTAVASAPRDVRVVWKFRPVVDHLGALLASEAALAAGKQGKFWQMHDKLFADPDFEQPKLEEHARQLGLDLAAFHTALEERTYSEQVARDLELSEELAIGNLPTLFINGRRLEYGGGGRSQPNVALTAEALRERIQQELQAAQRLVKQGVPAAKLYETLTAQGQEFGPPVGEIPALPTGLYAVDVGDSPVRGPQDAPITIVTFSDFQCPYCARLEKTLARVRSHYGDKVRIVWKDAPNMELHPGAMVAHEAARAAGEQGRFWEMHDRIFSRPFVLRRSTFEQYAAGLGLDLARFREALDSGRFQAEIREESAYGVSLAGPSGTPAVFVNGRLLPGAFPFETFRQVIDEELQRRKGL
ncbi:thioredoxin domain-containing protein [Cystobacter fuscus]|nr:thioredoxin domain-containing protein [Cystobacter fuscus]